MRYLGNKTKLIPFILRAVEDVQEVPGVACDPFAGTASVSVALKRAGWQVHSGDLMSASYALQVARVELDQAPLFPSYLLPTSARGGTSTISYGDLLGWLSQLARDGFVSEHYTLAGGAGRAHGRMYFSTDNGRRIDAIRETIDTWIQEDRLDSGAAQLLIATLIEAADRVANTTGVYASFVKTLQPNAKRDLELRPILATPRLNGGGSCTAFRGPATDLLKSIGPIDLVYLDPPYNGRQYPGYYHIPELLALGWSTPPELRGKTGLIPDEKIRSDWCRKSRADHALRAVLDAADARHILFSYNDEGFLSREEIESEFRSRGLPDSYQFTDRPYRRYRSDADGPGRNYRRDGVKEHLHYVKCA